MSASPTWVSAFLDLPSTSHDAAAAFWAAVTGYAVTAPRGAYGEFRTLAPPAGDAHLHLQQRAGGGPRVHLDLHVDDPHQAADRAVERGAREVRGSEDGYVVLASPGGLPFCLVGHRPSGRPEPAPPATWPGGHRSVVDQVCLDVAPAAYGAEAAFWPGVLGRSLHPSPIAPEFASMERPDGQPLRVLVQRLASDGAGVPPTRAHLDLACDDRPAEVRRHAALGAKVLARYPAWTVLADPAGLPYCITDRDPGTGRVVR